MSNWDMRSGCNCISALTTRLEAGYGAQAGEAAIQLISYFERGGEVSRAVYFWQQVGENMTRRHTRQETITALITGPVLLLTQLYGPEGIQHELTLQLTPGGAVILLTG